MNRITFLVVFLSIINMSFAQKWEKEVYCSKDTITAKEWGRLKLDNGKTVDTTKSYKAFECQTRSNWGARFDFSRTAFIYDSKTANVLGNHGAGSIGFVLAFNTINFGFKFKPATINPREALYVGRKILPREAKLNVIRLDYFLGYSIDLKKHISLEPYLGYNRTVFNVINEDELGENYSFSKVGGLITGLTINKYFKIKGYEYISIFGTIGYGAVDYSKVNLSFGENYIEWAIGVAYKGYSIKRFNKKITR